MKHIEQVDQISYLFNDKALLRTLRYLLVNDSSYFGAAELAKQTDLKTKDVNKALKQLDAAELLKVSKRKSGRAYRLDDGSHLVKPLRALLQFDYSGNKKAFKKLFSQAGKIDLVIFTGNLSNNKRSEVDVVVVGNELDDKKVSKLLQKIGYKVGYELSFVVFEPEEFRYRYEMKDRLVRNILDFDHEVIVGDISTITN